MSDEDKKKPGGTSDDLDLNWDDLAEWEEDIGLGKGVAAQAAPMPQKPPEAGAAKPAPAAPRALYRPPTGAKVPSPPAGPAPTAAGTGVSPRTRRASSPGDSSLFDDGLPEEELTPMRPLTEDEGATRVAAMPSELLDSLLGDAPRGKDKEGGDLDLDELLGGLGELPADPKPAPAARAAPAPVRPMAAGPATPARAPTVPKPGLPGAAPKPAPRIPLPPSRSSLLGRQSLSSTRPTVPTPEKPGAASAEPRHADLSDEGSDEQLTPVVPVPAARADEPPKPGAPAQPARPGLPPRPSLDALRAKRGPAEPAKPAVAAPPVEASPPTTPEVAKPATLDDLDAMLDALDGPASPAASPPAPAPEPARATAQGTDDDEDEAITGRPPPPAAPERATAIAASADDDEPSVTATEVDEDEGVDAMLDELAPPASDAPPAPAAPAQPAPRTSLAPGSDDRGAAAALRTVRSRKPRKESFPLVGRSTEAVAARRALLEALAHKATGGAKARLLTAAAELCEQLGDPSAARVLYASAREADPQDPVALRAVRRTAISSSSWVDAAQLLDAESRLPLGAGEQSYSLAMLAELSWRELGDSQAAATAIDRALALEPVSPLVALLATEIHFARGEDVAAAAAAEKLAAATTDASLAGALLAEAARVAEQRGDDARAKDLFQRAVAKDPTALDACLGLARSARKTGDIESAIGATTRASELVGGGAAREALQRAAALLAHHGAGRPADAVTILSDARGVSALRARAAAAAEAGDAEALVASLEGWAAAAGGTERTLALVELAEARASGGELDAADTALRDAALADPNLALVRVVREVLARKYGDASRLARLVESSPDGQGGGALVAAAKVARDRDSLDRERELLDRAAEEERAPIAADVLRLDVAASQRDLDGVRIAVRRQADRAAPEHRLGALLSLADLAMGAGDGPAAEALLREAREGAPGEPAALRPLGRLLAPSAPVEAAALWLEESASTSGELAAFAATSAGRLLEATAPSDAIAAFRRALGAEAGYSPAAWALESLARRAGDLDALAHVHEQQAEVAADPRESASRLVRAALLRAQDDVGRAATLLERALAVRPEDAIVRDLLLRVSMDRPAAERAALIEASATGASPDGARAARMRAGAAWEQGGEPARAAALYRAVLSESGGADVIARAGLDRAEMAASEVARVAERKFNAVREAQDDDARVLALEALADFDLHDRGDAASAVMSLQAILELAPGHLPTLRALERYFLEHARDEDLTYIEERLALHLPEPHDVAAHLRLAARLKLRPADAIGDAADSLLLEAGPRAEADLWLARRIEAAARASNDDARTAAATTALYSLLAGPSERATAAVRAAQAHARVGTAPSIIALLRDAVAAAPDHPIASEELARLEAESRDQQAAAEAYELAARASKLPARAAALWHRASVLWQDEVGDANRAAVALQAAAALDPALEDVFPRLVGILRARRANAELADLTAARVAAGGDQALLVGLYVELASLRMELGQREPAIEALRAALSLEPDRVEALRTLANLCFQDEDWRGATEALIRIARLTKDRTELRDVFFRLGDIYDEHLPDAKRADAAFRRALKLVEDDIPTMERLAKLYRRDGDAPQAIEMLTRLAAVDADPDRSRVHNLELAAVYEQTGETRAAEQALEQTRRLAPVDLGVLKAIADFYGRQNAQTALAMHLNRAVNDFRHALESDPTDHAAWSGLAQVLEWRGRVDPARCIASAAAALGIMDVELGKLLDAHGGAPGGGGGAADSELDDMLAPDMLTPATRAVFRLAADALEKTLPFDPKQIRAERVGRENPLRPMLDEVSRWFGASDVELYITTVAPRVCVPVSGQPIAIVVGRDIFTATDEREKLFLLARCFKIARSNLSVAVRTQPGDLALALAGLIRSFDMNYAPAGFAPAQLDDMARRVSKHVNKRVRDELLPNVLEMGGTPGFDPTRLALAASELGDRVALLATGSAPAAIGALLKLAGDTGGPPQTTVRVAAIRRLPSASALLGFAISDAHFEARHRAGADRR